MSVPFQPRNSAKSPIATFRAITEAKGLGDFYIVRFQEEGVEAQFEANVDLTIRASLYGLSGDAPKDKAWSPFLPKDARARPRIMPPEQMPAWVTEEDIRSYVEAFQISGFRGPLNWYRNHRPQLGLDGPIRRRAHHTASTFYYRHEGCGPPFHRSGRDTLEPERA